MFLTLNLKHSTFNRLRQRRGWGSAITVQASLKNERVCNPADLAYGGSRAFRLKTGKTREAGDRSLTPRLVVQRVIH